MSLQFFCNSFLFSCYDAREYPNPCGDCQCGKRYLQYLCSRLVADRHGSCLSHRFTATQPEQLAATNRYSDAHFSSPCVSSLFVSILDYKLLSTTTSCALGAHHTSSQSPARRSMRAHAESAYRPACTKTSLAVCVFRLFISIFSHTLPHQM
jgi:hypothetical protein